MSPMQRVDTALASLGSNVIVRHLIWGQRKHNRPSPSKEPPERRVRHPGLPSLGLETLRLFAAACYGKPQLQPIGGTVGLGERCVTALGPIPLVRRSTFCGIQVGAKSPLMVCHRRWRSGRYEQAR
jgi:hypothetical protein